jgi:porphobilinogen synthase
VIDRSRKDPSASAAIDPDNVVCRLLRESKRRFIPMAAITDLCLCEYTDHGHCGLLSDDGSTLQNDAAMELLAKQAPALTEFPPCRGGLPRAVVCSD